MRRARLRAMSMVAVIALAVGSAACGGGGNSVDATLSDFKIDLSSTSAKAGELTLKIKNNGPSLHEFVVFQTDLAPEALPTGEENGVPLVEEEGAEGLTLVDEVEDIENGASAELKLNLQAGKYVIICNIPAHYAQGMHTGFTVTG